ADGDGKPSGFLAVLRNITERKKLEAQLRQAQRMESIGALAGGVAHDFNNLLTVITGFSEILLSQLSANDPSRELVGEIRQAGDRAAALTRQLLAFSRKQLLSPKVIDLNLLVRETEKMLRRLIGEDIDLETRLGPGLGLATVYGIIKQSGGHIEVHSEIGRGTAFQIYLPRIPDEETPRPAQTGLAKIDQGTETILLVEDEASVRVTARHVLSASG